MNDGSNVPGRADHAAIEPPRWAHCLVVLADVVLLIGPTLGVLWPR